MTSPESSTLNFQSFEERLQVTDSQLHDLTDYCCRGLPGSLLLNQSQLPVALQHSVGNFQPLFVLALYRTRMHDTMFAIVFHVLLNIFILFTYIQA